MANVVYKWDGSGTWQRQYMGIDAGFVFRGVWGTGPSDLFLYRALFHSTGDGRWTQVSIPTVPAGTSVVGMWSSSPNDLWALDTDGIAHRRRDGQWAKTPTGLMRGLAIWGSSATDVYALWGFGVAHLKGTQWIVEQIDRGNDSLRCIWGSGAGDIYIGGESGRIYRSSGDGRWFVDQIPDAVGAVDGIWGTSSRSVYAISAAGIHHGK